MGWRSKLLLALVLYFGGFASAIYLLAPARDRDGKGDSLAFAEFDREVFVARTKHAAVVAKGGLEKFVAFASEKATETGELIRGQMAEREAKN